MSLSPTDRSTLFLFETADDDGEANYFVLSEDGGEGAPVLEEISSSIRPISTYSKPIQVGSQKRKGDTASLSNLASLVGESGGRVDDKWTRLKDSILLSISNICEYRESMKGAERQKLMGKAADATLTSKSELRNDVVSLIDNEQSAIKDILNQFKAINCQDKVWTQLQESGEDGLVDLEGIVCSRCDMPDTEGNDILICDRIGCYRAYHQKCLDSPFHDDCHVGDTEDPWFCWECENLDVCLQSINDVYKSDFKTVIEVSSALDRNQAEHMLTCFIHSPISDGTFALPPKQLVRGGSNNFGRKSTPAVQFCSTIIPPKYNHNVVRHAFIKGPLAGKATRKHKLVDIYA